MKRGRAHGIHVEHLSRIRGVSGTATGHMAWRMSLLEPSTDPEGSGVNRHIGLQLKAAESAHALWDMQQDLKHL